jgi:hypothetical protein
MGVAGADIAITLTGKGVVVDDGTETIAVGLDMYAWWSSPKWENGSACCV